MKRLILYLLYMLLLTACAAPAPAQEETPEVAQLIAMDTLMTFTAYGEDAKAVVQQAAEAMRTAEAMFSRTLPESEVSRLNAQGSGKAGPELQRLLEAASHYWRETGGAFDITVAPVASAWSP